MADCAILSQSPFESCDYSFANAMLFGQPEMNFEL